MFGSRSLNWQWLVVFLFCCVLLLRLGWLQIFQRKEYQVLAENNRFSRQIIRAPRGIIEDRYGKVLADNERLYTVLDVSGEQVRETRVDQAEALDRLATAPAQIRMGFQRRYPFGAVIAHVVGYIQRPRESHEILQGRSGVEKQENDFLSGEDGWILYERDARGVATRVLERHDSRAGQTVRLTVDAELSRVAFDALGDQRGAVIVGIPHTGEVLAAVSKPSFLPVYDLENGLAADNQVAPSISTALDFPHNPFLFRPLAAVYPPGSLFKIVTALAGLERDAISLSTQVLDEGKIEVGEFTYQNWYWRQFGRTEGNIDVTQALARSNDIFFYKVAEWLGPQALADFARYFSYGESTEIDLSGEKQGIIPDPAWKQRVFGEKWYLGNTYHMGIGQGDVLATPLQVHTMMSTVADGGRRCVPHLLATHRPSCLELSLSQESLGTVIRGLRLACSSGGTAFPFFTTSYDVMCKTGTAEFGEADEQGHRSTHGWFSVAVNADERQEVRDDFSTDIVVTVIVESSKAQPFQEGSRDAAPVARKIADWWVENRSGNNAL